MKRRGSWRPAGIGGPLADVAVAAVLTVVALVELLGAGSGAGPLEVLLVVLQTVPLAVRRAAPFGVYLVIGLSISAYAALGQEASIGPVGTFVALYGVASLGSRGQSLAALALQALGVTWFFLSGSRFPMGDVTEAFVLSGLAWTAGAYVKTRRLYAAEVEARVEALEHMREQESLQAAAEERTRIARELHDLVGHAVTLMVVQAGGGRQGAAADPVRAGAVFRTIEETGRQALGELDRLLGILRPDGEGAELAPQAGLDQLEALAVGFGEAGLPVQVRVEGEPVTLAPALERSAYRIVQEALTNSLRHAGPAAATVTLRYAAECLELEVADDGRGGAVGKTRGGRGLPGMRERVALFGGALDAGPRPGGGFVVRCRIPLEAS